MGFLSLSSEIDNASWILRLRDARCSPSRSPRLPEGTCFLAVFLREHIQTLDRERSAEALTACLQLDGAITCSGAFAPSRVRSIVHVVAPEVRPDIAVCKPFALRAQALRNSRHNPGKRVPTVVSRRFRGVGAATPSIGGGTLGVFLALALQVSVVAVQ